MKPAVEAYIMNIATKRISIQQQTFILTNQRAAFWPGQKALILSDLHIGKTAHFRKNGIALSDQVMKKDLDRLSQLITHFRPEKFIVVGDLLHAGDNSDVDQFCAWKEQYPEVCFYLVEGNHDRISRSLEQKLCLEFKQNSLDLDDFTFLHDFKKGHPKFQITGHIHPGIVLNSRVRRFRLPCFALTPHQLLLPAFSEFTGLDTVNTPKKGTFFVFTDSEIHEV